MILFLSYDTILFLSHVASVDLLLKPARLPICLLTKFPLQLQSDVDHQSAVKFEVTECGWVLTVRQFDCRPEESGGQAVGRWAGGWDGTGGWGASTGVSSTPI